MNLHYETFYIKDRLFIFFLLSHLKVDENFVFRLANLASFAYTLQSSELLSLGMPDFPVENLKYVVEIMVSFKKNVVTRFCRLVLHVK